MTLSNRIRPDVEAAPWVVEGIKRLEAELAAAYDELHKQRPAIKAVFDREVWSRVRQANTAQEPSSLRLVEADKLESLEADSQRMEYIRSVTRCDPKMDGNHLFWGIGSRPLAGSSLRQAIDNELVRMYGEAKMPSMPHE